MKIKTSKQILAESNFNYLYPSASIKQIKEAENKKWVSVDSLLKHLEDRRSMVMLRTGQTERQKRILCYFIGNLKKELGDDADTSVHITGEE